MARLSRAVSDGAGNLYIADPVNNDVVKVDTSGNATVLLGSSGATYTFSLKAPGGIADRHQRHALHCGYRQQRDCGVAQRRACFSAETAGTQTPGPSAVAVDPSGGVWVAMTDFGHVYGFKGGFLWADIHPTGATALNNPQGIAVDGNQNVYIADYGADHVVDAKYYGQTDVIVSTGSIVLGIRPAWLVDRTAISTSPTIPATRSSRSRLQAPRSSTPAP